VYQGLLVATHAIAVPEPSSLTLAAWGGIVALLAGFQRRKR
jgi:hypothetical protein